MKQEQLKTAHMIEAGQDKIFRLKHDIEKYGEGKASSSGKLFDVRIKFANWNDDVVLHLYSECDHIHKGEQLAESLREATDYYISQIADITEAYHKLLTKDFEAL